MRTTTFYIKNLIGFLAFLCMLSCKKFVTISPPITQITNPVVFASDATAQSAMDGIFSSIMNNTNNFACGATGSVTFLAGLSSDEFINYSTSPDQIGFYVNDVLPNNGTLLASLWGSPYNLIYQTNAVLEGVTASNTLSPAIKNEIDGEAKFMRAFCYFYLVNMFGDVPLILKTNYNENATTNRSSVNEIYAQIIADLKDAKGLLNSDYSYSSGERIRPNQGAATALLARTYLFTGDWVHAEAEAGELINNNLYGLDANLNDIFLANSQEAILQFMPVTPGRNTWEGYYFILSQAPEWVSLTDIFLNQFEANDNRRSIWIDSTIADGTTYFFPFKYKVSGINDEPLTEYSMVLRLAEQYLIRAEARIMQDDLQGGVDDINIIRVRAGLNPAPVSDRTTLLQLLFHERQIELFSEWGHRWFDLKRTGQANSLLAPIKGPAWQATDTLYPIPQSEIQNNQNLTQNPGY